MSFHLTEEHIKKYHSRELSASELLQLDEHIEKCADCSARLLRSSKRKASFDLSSEEDHLEYEQLVGYLEQTLNPSDRENLVMHLETCRSCAENEQDLRRFRKTIGTRRNIAVAIVRIAGMAAAITLLVLAAKFLFMDQQVSPQAAFVIRDGDHRIPFDKERRILDDEWNIPQGRQLELQKLLQGEALRVPPLIKELKGKKLTLLTDEIREPSVKLMEPLGTIVRSDTPTFRWEGPADASSYSITIYNTTFDPVAQSPSLREKHWTIKTPLERGKTYIWIVSSLIGDRVVKAPLPPEPEARFQVLGTNDFQKLEQNISQLRGSHLFLGHLYAEFGLLEDAEKEWSKLATENPESAEVKMLLKSLENIRRVD